MLKLALTHHGHSITSEQVSEPVTSSPSAPESRTGRPQNIIGLNSNSLDDFPPVERPSTAHPEPPEAGEQDGVYL